MPYRQVFAVFAAASCVCALTAAVDGPVQATHVGSVQVFTEKYLDFARRQAGSTSPNTIVVALGHVKGLARSFTGAAGRLSMDLASGSFSAEFTGLERGVTYTLWLVDQPDNRPVSDLAAVRSFKLARVPAGSGTTRVTGSLAAAAEQGLTVDRVVLAREGAPLAEMVASGSMGLLQKLHFGRAEVAGQPQAGRRLRFASLVPAVGLEGSPASGGAVAATGADVVALDVPLDVLIAQGEQLFFQETFSGNGRTCGTCHPVSRNFTIDPEFIATLPPQDPLFVAEFNPALAQLERPALMRQFGLILENVDGLDNPTVKFVMRSVPHTLGMSVSLAQDANLAGAPTQMTGWSGDGAPGTGSLREFAIGAVTQHFPKTLNRVAGVDFVLPSNQQLDAMEAFQLSLGRTADFDLAKITFLDAGVANGQSLFNNGVPGQTEAAGRCSVCHANGGALVAAGQNRNFNTNVEDVPHPARSVQNFPIDGGFGLTANADGSFGNRGFNTAPVVEAADTPPFFHNNVVNTLEEVVAFYAGPQFNAPRPPAARFSFTQAQITDIANFMRGLNTLQNIDVARRALQEVLALTGNPQPQVQSRLESARLDCGDAIRVLGETSLFPAASAQIAAARQLIVQAQGTNNPNSRNTVIDQAIDALDAAEALVANITP
jgi:cytochrome c peroxidase